MTDFERERLIGRGWGAPLRVGGGGGIELVDGNREIEEAIAVILATAPGERVMRPEFGCRIHELVFSPVNSETLGMAQRYVEEALGRWEPRVDVRSVRMALSSDDESNGLLRITVDYAIRATKDERTLVYPFYIIEHEGQ
jgi:uncharacterized protein